MKAHKARPTTIVAEWPLDALVAIRAYFNEQGTEAEAEAKAGLRKLNSFARQYEKDTAELRKGKVRRG